MTADPSPARATWRTLEPLHGMVYFVAEREDEYAAIGLTDARGAYFASRAAAMGPVPAEVVIATFFNFEPGLVARHVPAVWATADPASVLDARLRVVDRALRRLLGADVASAEMAEAAALAREATEACTLPGRPLYAAHAALPWPDEPHLALWHAQTLLREFRGDGHVAALTEAGLDGCEALVTHGAAGDVPPTVLQATRSWPDEAWAAAVDRLRARGWLDDEGGLTDEGRARRDGIERRTDELAAGPYARLGDERCRRLRELCRPWSRTISAEVFGRG